MAKTKILSKPLGVLKTVFIPATVGGLAVGLGTKMFGLLGTIAGAVISGAIFKGVEGQIVATNGIMDAMEAIFLEA